MFKVTNNKGFHMTFANGCTISVQWGPGNYCDNYNNKEDYGMSVPASSTAEVMAWDAYNNIMHLEDNDEVVGHCNADTVAHFIVIVSSYNQI